MSADSENSADRKKQGESGPQIEGEPEIILSEITKRLADLPQLNANTIEIHVNDDQVELQGSLPSQEMLNITVRIASEVQGVEHVHWNIDLPHGLHAYGSTHGPGEGPDDDEAGSTHGEGEGPDDIA